MKNNQLTLINANEISLEFFGGKFYRRKRIDLYLDLQMKNNQFTLINQFLEIL